MQWKGRKVLVTGVGGFIGSHLCERLLHEGAEVRAFVRYNSRNDPGLLCYLDRRLFSVLDLQPGDLRDSGAVQRAVHGVDVIFHLGALIGIPYSYRNPREVVDTNIMGTLNVLEAARQHEVQRVVHTSTSEVYGTARMERIHEGHPLHGQSPYSASKIGADKLVESYVRSFGVQAVTIRPFNTYGPRQSRRALIPTVVSQALQGSTIKMGSLDTIRDFTYVADTVAGMIAAATADDVIGEEINLGSDSEVSSGEVVRLVGALLNRELKVETQSDRIRPAASEVQRLRSDNSKAATRLGWKPAMSFEEGLRNVIAWFVDHPIMRAVDHYEV
ncbi:MAG: SDR family NAD(P)-dependent oxidoreductase [Nitrospira sp.]